MLCKQDRWLLQYQGPTVWSRLVSTLRAERDRESFSASPSGNVWVCRARGPCSSSPSPGVLELLFVSLTTGRGNPHLGDLGGPSNHTHTETHRLIGSRPHAGACVSTSRQHCPPPGGKEGGTTQLEPEPTYQP